MSRGHETSATRGEAAAGLRVLHVTDASASGVLTAVAAIARSQAADPRFHEVTIGYVPRPESPSEREIRDLTGPGVRLRRWSDDTGAVRLLHLCRELHRALVTDRPDIVHLHSSRAGLLGRWVAWVSGARRRVIYSPHAFAFAYAGIGRAKASIWWLAELTGALAGHRLVLASESEQAVARRRLPAVRTRVLPNGVDVAALRAARTDVLAGAAATAESAVPSFAHVGRIAAAKNPALFTEVARRVVGQLPTARPVWLGDGDRELLVDPDRLVEVSGWLTADELRRRLAQVGLLLFTSNGEGMSMAVLEAQAMGIPVVASAVTGVVDIVRDGATGVLADSAEQLADAAVEVLTDSERAAELSRGAVARAADFDSALLGERSLQAYTALLRLPAVSGVSATPRTDAEQAAVVAAGGVR